MKRITVAQMLPIVRGAARRGFRIVCKAFWRESFAGEPACCCPATAALLSQGDWRREPEFAGWSKIGIQAFADQFGVSFQYAWGFVYGFDRNNDDRVEDPDELSGRRDGLALRDAVEADGIPVWTSQGPWKPLLPPATTGARALNGSKA